MAWVERMARTVVVGLRSGGVLFKDILPRSRVIALLGGALLLETFSLLWTMVPHYPSPLVLASHTIFEMLPGSHSHRIRVQKRAQNFLDICPAKQTH